MGAALDTVRRVLAAFDAGDEAALRELLDDDLVLEAPGGVVARGRDAAAGYVAGFVAAFGELAAETHVLAEQDDMVVEEYTLTITHTGPYVTAHGERVEPTGARVSLRVAEVYRVRAGRLVENRVYFDEPVLLDRLRASRP
ncbi:nuclear transport factor 2 family protein [Frankia sp. CNm7]|uniref:Nuclear transport factor 2 family protein n=1 Tax=Frankia nepalensis TaxID=1836974 RepID=A0A937RHJ2_9ACTN|nr:nuclear transport factor 2 family protein [Frankia nepalensis]MBL7499611.1 nuclear transport factor 2 family protein [Frankia nepalensis]MBL7515730.1 nuclear transport factor 2 family protein [Frankia nepalensis]MBL7520107.1 nuclear transport factor 2 family protein [Frankia nepalensis]MBL7626498.1 nuclear transport factor 2 family protein [Frankia nepalensis]